MIPAASAAAVHRRSLLTAMQTLLISLFSIMSMAYVTVPYREQHAVARLLLPLASAALAGYEEDTTTWSALTPVVVRWPHSFRVPSNTTLAPSQNTILASSAELFGSEADFASLLPSGTSGLCEKSGLDQIAKQSGS